MEGGTISLNIQTTWQASYLTPGIDPHFFYWKADDKKNGIVIKSDSNKLGRITAEITRNGVRHLLRSDVTPIRNEPYFIALRFNNEAIQLVINNQNIVSISGDKLPDVTKLADSFFVGSTPESEDFAAFALLTHLKIYGTWLSDDDLEAIREQ